MADPTAAELDELDADSAITKQGTIPRLIKAIRACRQQSNAKDAVIAAWQAYHTHPGDSEWTKLAKLGAALDNPPSEAGGEG